MYSTCMKNDRYVVKCLIVSEYVTLEKFIVDTGARFSCCNYRIVDRVTDIILGMDILKQMMIILNPYNRRIYFCKDAEDYQRHFMLAMP